MSEACEHYLKPCPFAGGAEDGARVCYFCSRNTMKGVWPAKESLPAIQMVTVNGQSPVQPTAIPYDDWPSWAKVVKYFRKATDKGVGDTVESTIGPATSAAFKAWHKAMFGTDCGCSSRKELWNAQYPYQEE